MIKSSRLDTSINRQCFTLLFHSALHCHQHCSRSRSETQFSPHLLDAEKHLLHLQLTWTALGQSLSPPPPHNSHRNRVCRRKLNLLPRANIWVQSWQGRASLSFLRRTSAEQSRACNTLCNTALLYTLCADLADSGNWMGRVRASWPSTECCSSCRTKVQVVKPAKNYPC